MKSLTIPKNKLSWLLEDNNPPVRNLTKKFLLDQKITSDELAEVNQYQPIKQLLSLMKPNGSWSNPENPYQKYQGDYWQIIFLCELNANPSDDQIQKACSNILDFQLLDGTFPLKPRMKSTSILCLSANILRSLIYFGFDEDDRILRGIDVITDHIMQNNGILCSGMTYSLLSDCQMALTKILSMYEMIAKNRRTVEIQKAMEVIIGKIVENRVYRYLPAGTTELKHLIKNKKTREIPPIIEEMQKNPKHLVKNLPKKGWQNFGFPHSYTSDILETLYYLAKLDIELQNEFEEAIEVIKQKMTPEGIWLNENKFRNPMLVEIESRKSPSKWITLRAYYVLMKYSNMLIEQ